MTTSPDHPELTFLQAAGFTSGRPDGPPLWWIIHTMEAGESSTTAENTAAYFHNPSDGRDVSAHYCADNDSIVQCVRLRDSAWTVGNRPGNNRGINCECAGFAAQTAAQWGDAYSTAMLRRIAPLAVSDCQRYAIPLRRCSVAELQAFKPGITSHNDLRLAFGGTTHTDPGPNFPWDWFISLLNGHEEAGVSDIKYRIQSSDPMWNGQVFVSNRIHRRGPLRSPGTIQGPATTGCTEVILTDAMRTDAQASETWESYLDAVAGPVFPDIPSGVITTTDHTHDLPAESTGPAIPIAT